MDARIWERAMKRQEILLQAFNGQINWVQAAEILGISARQIRRIKKAWEKAGSPALVDKRYGGSAWNRVDDAIRNRVTQLYREQYFDFNVKHFHEKLQAEHGIKQSYNWVLWLLQESKLVAKNRMRDKHRKRRERRPLEGMMIHLDGSDHRWLGESHPKWDLLATLDDATNEVYDAFFVPEENTVSVLQILSTTIEKRGVFCSLYTDRARHFVVTDEAGQRPSKAIRTQCQRALDQLGIKLIAANSPQARGRGERLWRTFQGRLPQELRLNKIKNIIEANTYLRSVFIPDYNKRFNIESKEKGSAFVPLASLHNLNQIFSIQHERIVSSDNTISYKTKTFQLPESSLRYSFARCRVTIHEHLDGTYSVSFGPHSIAKYSSALELMENQNKPKKKAA